MIQLSSNFHRTPFDYDIVLFLRARSVMKPVIKSLAGRHFGDVERFLRNWSFRDTLFEGHLANARNITNLDNWNISILEIDGGLEGVSLWSRLTDDEITVSGLTISDKAIKAGLGAEFLKHEIMEWAELKILKASLVISETETEKLVNILTSCGFIYEGISWCARTGGSNSIRFCKKFVYDTILQPEIMNFLDRLFISWGYETKVEADNLLYRLKVIYQNPFLFPPWHRISRQAHKFIVSPPARPLEAHELETLLFPLIVKGVHEKPLLVTIDKKRASGMIELPPPQQRDDNLFVRDDSSSRQFTRNLVYTFPTGFQEIRHGLPVLFYVNGVGAVGEARIADWSFEDPGHLCKALYNDEKYDLEHIREHAGVSGPKAGKVLVLRYEFYRVFTNPVQLEQMKRHDKDFNPQRQRSISYDFFQAISQTGTQ